MPTPVLPDTRRVLVVPEPRAGCWECCSPVPHDAFPSSGIDSSRKPHFQKAFFPSSSRSPIQPSERMKPALKSLPASPSTPSLHQTACRAPESCRSMPFTPPNSHHRHPKGHRATLSSSSPTWVLTTDAASPHAHTLQWVHVSTHPTPLCSWGLCCPSNPYKFPEGINPDVSWPMAGEPGRD